MSELIVILVTIWLAGWAVTCRLIPLLLVRASEDGRDPERWAVTRERWEGDRPYRMLVRILLLLTWPVMLWLGLGMWRQLEGTR